MNVKSQWVAGISPAGDKPGGITLRSDVAYFISVAFLFCSHVELVVHDGTIDD